MDLIEIWDRHVKSTCENVFESPRFVRLGIINKNWLKHGFEKSSQHDPRYIAKMLGLLALELWLRHAELDR
jgi:hypothetical protein